jgi:glycerophosphoryl diester phosphodiesterase
MKYRLTFWLVLAALLAAQASYSQNTKLTLIAHRGGVVDSSFTENGMPALQAAVREGYQMIETDVRVTKDGVLIAHHDADLKRYYGADQKVAETEWAKIRDLKSTLDRSSPVLLEDILRFCNENKLGVMLDNKIAGMDSVLFNRLLSLLQKYNLRESALMIGTDESTNFFRGKIKLSCSREQLETNMKMPGFKATDYFLFERPSRLTKADITWANSHNIMVVAAFNKYHYRNAPDMMGEAARDCRRMLTFGVTSFQIDSEFQKFLITKPAR